MTLNVFTGALRLAFQIAFTMAVVIDSLVCMCQFYSMLSWLRHVNIQTAWTFKHVNIQTLWTCEHSKHMNIQTSWTLKHVNIPTCKHFNMWTFKHVNIQTCEYWNMWTSNMPTCQHHIVTLWALRVKPCVMTYGAAMPMLVMLMLQCFYVDIAILVMLLLCLAGNVLLVNGNTMAVLAVLACSVTQYNVGLMLPIIR